MHSLPEQAFRPIDGSTYGQIISEIFDKIQHLKFTQLHKNGQSKFDNLPNTFKKWPKASNVAKFRQFWSHCLGPCILGPYDGSAQK